MLMLMLALENHKGSLTKPSQVKGLPWCNTYIHIDFGVIPVFSFIHLNPLPPQPPRSSLKEGGETQTGVQSALSAPQPLNTYPALPFENKPWRRAPGLKLSPRSPAHIPDALLGAPPPPDTPQFGEADVRMAATRRDVLPGDVAAIKARRDAAIVSITVTTFKVDVNGQK